MPPPESEFTANGGHLRVPLDSYLRQVAREAATAAVADLEPRVRRMELRFAALLGFMLGSGFLGGFVGGLLSTLLQS